MINKEVVVKVENLNKSFGKEKVLHNVSFELYKSEIVGFIGPNGAGKTTTMKCLCNLIYPDNGSIIISGHDLSKERSKVLGHIAALIEAPGLYHDMTGKENINLIGRIRKTSKNRMDEIEVFTELGNSLDKRVSTYSMGMKQRLALGIAIMNKPKFLILDEPTNGLDPTGIIQLRETLQALVKNESITILFSSHQLGEIEKLADRIICINKGKIIQTPQAFEDKNAYFLQVKDNRVAHSVITSMVDASCITLIGNTTMRIVINEQTELGQVLNRLIQNSIMIEDIYKDALDVETVYSQVYGNV